MGRSAKSGSASAKSRGLIGSASRTTRSGSARSAPSSYAPSSSHSGMASRRPRSRQQRGSDDPHLAPMRLRPQVRRALPVGRPSALCSHLRGKEGGGVIEFPKIETLYERGADFSVTDVLRSPVIGTISKWLVTEKVDGTNIRIDLRRT